MRCRRRDSNPYDVNHYVLNVARLPNSATSAKTRASTGNRTRDLSLTRRLLHLLSYAGIRCRWWESNPRSQP